MEEFVLFNPGVHLEEFIQLCVESLTWHCDELEKNYGIDAISIIGQSIPEWVEDNLESYISMKPPVGILYILEVEGEPAGMGAIMKLDDNRGEIHRIFNRPKYRGIGLMQQMVNRLLDDGRELGFSKVLLATPKFAHAAQHIYRKTGFKERPIFEESEVHPDLRPYWIYMEKNF